MNILPIELISFEVYPQNYDVFIRWATSTETNNAYFTIERSSNARDFDPIAIIDGAGNSHSTINYTAIDERPLMGISFYRLKQTDFDGQFSYSDVQSVSFTNEGTFGLEFIYRDQSNLNLIYTSTSPYVLIEIYDLLGKRLFVELSENYGGQSVVQPSLASGAYIVRISDGVNSDSGKVFW